MRKLFLFFSIGLLCASLPARAGILEDFPGLKKLTFRESDSELFLGFGVSPISVLRNQVMFSLNVFQLQWLHRKWDVELLSASFGFSMSNDSISSSRHFTVRTSPKYRLTNFLSIGAVVGMEFVSFPDLNARFYKDGLFSPYEPFSGNGLIYGVSASENFKLSDSYYLKINQMIYQQTYATTQTLNGWTYLFQNTAIQADRTPIKPSLVFALEVSLLY